MQLFLNVENLSLFQKKCNMKSKIPRKCPECDSQDVIPIRYGFPGPEMMEDSFAGKIALGGCVIGFGNPHWHCKKCGHRW